MAAIVLAVILLPRVFLALHQPDFRYPDERLYFDIAKHISQENRYAVTHAGAPFAVRQAPGLPVTLGVVDKFCDLTPLKVKLINGMVSALTAVLYGLAVWVMTRNRTAVVVMVLMAGLHPVLLYAGITNYPQTYQGFWFAGLVAWLCWRYSSCKGKRPVTGLWDGVLAGMGALYVPTQLFILPALIAFHFRRGASWVTRYTLFVALGLILTISPWMVRNALVEREFIPFSTSGGEQLFLGFNEQAGMNTGIQITLPPDLANKIEKAESGKAVERHFAAYAKTWIQAHPLSALKLLALKLLNFFRLNNGAMVTEAERSTAREGMAAATTLFVFGMALWGSWELRRRMPEWTVFTAVLMLALAAGHACFIARYRYRLPFEPYLLFVGVIGWFSARKRV